KIKLIAITVVPANEIIAQSLGVELDAAIQRIERIRKANGEPTQYEIAYIPWSVAPGITKEHAETSLYASLRDAFDVHIASTTENVEITLAEQRVSTHLECKEGLPCFYMETIAVDNEGTAVEFSRSYFRGDKTNFTIERNYP